ncbi:MAG: hypothetical protein ACI85Q_000769 [Salibacteraceae bacterium]|jgi:hypothetical protein
MGDYWNEDIVRTSVANQKLNIQGEHPAPFPNEISHYQFFKLQMRGI